MLRSPRTSALLVLLLTAAIFACPRSAEAKNCTSIGMLTLINSAGVEVILDLPPQLANGTYDYGTIGLLPGDQLIWKVKLGMDWFDCTIEVTHDGEYQSWPLSGNPVLTYNVSQPGDYTTYNTNGTLNPASPGQHCAFSVTQITDVSEPIDLLMRIGCSLQGNRTTTGYGMRWDLAPLGHIPCSEPYSAMGYPTSPGGVEQVDGCVDLFVQRQIVDWVHVELLDPTSPSTIVSSANGLLSSTGVILSTDGLSPLHMTAPPGNYRLRIEHRNHLGLITDQAIPFRGQAPVIMTYPSGPGIMLFVMGFPVPPYPTCADATCTMRLGNTNSVDTPQHVSYIGAGNDRDPILVRIGGSTVTNVVSGYYTEDVNMDGVVKYVGENNDRDPILEMIGGSTPTNVVYGQTP